MAERYPTGITTQFSLQNLGRTLNPFSKILGGNDPQYVPEGLIRAAKNLNTDKSWTNAKAAKMAHIFTKVIGGGLAAGGLFALLRLGAHTIDMDKINMAGKTAGQDLQKQYMRPTSPYLLPDKTKEQNIEPQSFSKQALWDPYSTVIATVPPVVSLLAAATAFKKADQYADQRESQQLNKNIASTLKDINTIGLSNIRKVRQADSQAPKKKDKKKPMQKSAAEGVSSAAAFLALLLSGASVLTGYHMQRAFDPATIKYKALKKGIQEYTKARALQGMQQTQPIDKQLLASLDPKKKSGKAAVDQLPEVDTNSMYRPVDV